MGLDLKQKIKPQVLSKGSDFYISLSKLHGKKVVDLEGYITREFGDLTFEIRRVVLEDGTKLYCGGEVEGKINNLEDLAEDEEEEIEEKEEN